MRFIKLDAFGEEWLVNVDQIAAIFPLACTVFVGSNHGEGDGVVHISQDSMDKLIKYIEQEGGMVNVQ